MKTWRESALALLAVAGSLAAGCGEVRVSMRDPKDTSPTARTGYAREAGRRASPQDVRTLIRYLEDLDVVVRWTAFRCLAGIAGKDFDYVPTSDPEARRASINKWKEWYENHYN